MVVWGSQAGVGNGRSRGWVLSHWYLYGSVDSTRSKVSFDEAADLTFSSSRMWTAL